MKSLYPPKGLFSSLGSIEAVSHDLEMILSGLPSIEHYL
jgi:hypothetical protein